MPRPKGSGECFLVSKRHHIRWVKWVRERVTDAHMADLMASPFGHLFQFEDDEYAFQGQYVAWKTGFIAGNHKQLCKFFTGLKDELRAECELDLDDVGVEAKIYEWGARFHNFKYLLTLPGVSYDQSHNSVEARIDVWSDIAREGEFNWDKLKSLFEEVVDLSSDTIRACRYTSEGSESVSTPLNRSKKPKNVEVAPRKIKREPK